MVSKPPLSKVWVDEVNSFGLVTKFRIIKCTSLSTGELATSGILERSQRCLYFHY